MQLLFHTNPTVPPTWATWLLRQKRPDHVGVAWFVIVPSPSNSKTLGPLVIAIDSHARWHYGETLNLLEDPTGRKWIRFSATGSFSTWSDTTIAGTLDGFQRSRPG